MEDRKLGVGFGRLINKIYHPVSGLIGACLDERSFVEENISQTKSHIASLCNDIIETISQGEVPLKKILEDEMRSHLHPPTTYIWNTIKEVDSVVKDIRDIGHRELDSVPNKKTKEVLVEKIEELNHAFNFLEICDNIIGLSGNAGLFKEGFGSESHGIEIA